MKTFSLTFLLLLTTATFSQGLTSQQQQKLDSLLAYINNSMRDGKSPDQKYIDSVNTVIRNMTPVSVKADTTGKAKTDSIKEITKQSMAGSSFIVPAGKIWTVKKLYVNDGGSYNILVTSLKFEKPLKEGEKLFTPTWCAEAELLNGDKSGFSYIYKIEESNVKK